MTAWVCSASDLAVHSGVMFRAHIAASMSASSVAAWPVMQRPQASRMVGAVS
jgi:hypothetical protein